MLPITDLLGMRLPDRPDPEEQEESLLIWLKGAPDQRATQVRYDPVSSPSA